MNCLNLKITPARLRCEALIAPLAVQVERPRLSWIVETSERNVQQSAYQILASSTQEKLGADQGDLWDSGRIDSDESLHIEYRGRALIAAQRCYWKVRVWDQNGDVSDWSPEAMFGVGLNPSDWISEWIGFDQTRNLDLPPAPFDGASWIWLGNEIVQQRNGVFVGTLHLPEDVIVEDSQLALAVSGRYRFFWRGEQFGKSDDEPESWRRPYIRHMNERLHPGANEFIIKAEQIDNEPVGILFKVVVRARDGLTYTMVSDGEWRATDQVKEESATATTDAENTSHASGSESIATDWPRCRTVAHYGDAPWGLIRGQENILPPPAWLRGIVHVNGPIRRAVLFATALGNCDLHLNGNRINLSYFDPGWTDYHQRLHYRAYDVTALLKVGENVMGAVLADGWFSGYIGWGHQRDLYGKHPRFRAQLHLEFVDGSSAIIGTDSTWKASIGPTKEADMLMGEFHDAREEFNGWAETGFDDTHWRPVDCGSEIAPLLLAHPAPPVVALEEETFSPQSITEPVPGVFVFDLGQNFAGIARLKLCDTQPGQKIVLRYAERLKEDGTLYTVNLRTARATDTYICRGDEEEVWSPRFTFHGFQFVEVTGLRSKPSTGTITGIPLSTDTPRAGNFECSDVLANRLASNVYWSQRSNFLEVPTDCPQRDERLGWCDGAWTFVGAAALRADVQTFYTKWMHDLDDAQGADGLFPWLAPLVVATPESGGAMWSGCSPAWSDAGIICPWEIYQIYGDERQLAEHYPAMLRQVEWYRKTSRPDLLPPAAHKCLGDWLNYDAPIPPDVFRTLFFAYGTGLLARSAEILGKNEEAVRYKKLHHEIKSAFQRAYVDHEGRILGDTQGGYAFALVFELLEEEQVPVAARHLVENIRRHDWRPTTGLEGTLPLMLALAKIGRNDIAYRLLHNETFPSWNFSIKNGATSIWERWDSWTPENGFGDPNMNSFNHFSIGAVYQWMVENIGGIRKGARAYKQMVIAPCPGGKLTSARVSHDSVRGLIRTEWKLTDDGLELAVQIPGNTTATLILPARYAEDVTESGQPLSTLGERIIADREAPKVCLTVGSGRYHFQIRHPILAEDSNADEALISAPTGPSDL